MAWRRAACLQRQSMAVGSYAVFPQDLRPPPSPVNSRDQMPRPRLQQQVPHADPLGCLEKLQMEEVQPVWFCHGRNKRMRVVRRVSMERRPQRARPRSDRKLERRGRPSCPIPVPTPYHPRLYLLPLLKTLQCPVTVSREWQQQQPPRRWTRLSSTPRSMFPESCGVSLKPLALLPVLRA